MYMDTLFFQANVTLLNHFTFCNREETYLSGYSRTTGQIFCYLKKLLVQYDLSPVSRAVVVKKNHGKFVWYTFVISPWQ